MFCQKYYLTMRIKTLISFQNATMWLKPLGKSLKQANLHGPMLNNTHELMLHNN